MSYTTVSPTGSLLLSIRPRPQAALLVIGSNRLAASRIFTALEASYRVYVTFSAANPDLRPDAEIVHRIANKEVDYLDLDETTLLDTVAVIPNLDIVCITDSLQTASSPHRRSFESCQVISHYCLSRRIHINVVDWTSLNDISFPATHRWRSSSGDTAHSLQIAVNTFGKGCRLATRIKREVVSALLPETGRAVDNIALIRSKIIDLPSLDDEDDQIVSEPINSPVPQFESPRPDTGYFLAEDVQDARKRRMKWVAQISEYWPIKTIGRLREADIDRLLTDFDGLTTPAIPSANPTPIMSRSPSIANLTLATQEQPTSIDSRLSSTPNTLHSLNISRPPELQARTKPRILLIGSGPGHPALLTLAAHNALKTADLVLADKLVPSAILHLIPSTTQLYIAKKFPGNAENAQVDLQRQALAFLESRTAAGQSGTVIRLKQGDPYIYGRGGEELLFFRANGYDTMLVPGISSSFAAPLLCDIPVTQRGVSDSLILCTGVGRAGKTSTMPGYVRSRTLVVLMGVARIDELVHALVTSSAGSSEPVDVAASSTRREGLAYPDYLPIALIERGSSPDQRLILSTLAHISQAILRVGDQRPPGMLVIGWSCLALEGPLGNVDVTESAGMQAGVAGDIARVQSVFGSKDWIVREGVRPDWMSYLDEMARI